MLPSVRVVAVETQMSARVAALRPDTDVVQREMFAQIYGALFDAPPEPVMLGRYMVLERRGAGGMGTVFAAFDRALQRRVALKVLHRSHARDREDAILREARVLAKVTDPHVVAIFDVGRDGDDAWIAMEYVDGVEIGSAARAGASESQLAEWLAQAASGVAAAHAAGVVHGDLKPSNILVATDGRAKVVDFGMATVAGASRIVGGTTGYLAPELEGGAPPTAAGDVFALCVTATELHPHPWPRRLARTIARGLGGAATRPSLAEVAAALRSVAQRPRDRTRSAIVLGVGVAVIAATYGGSTRTECDLPLQPRWQEDLRARAEAALVQRGEAKIWATVAPVLDARSIAWTDARDVACASSAAIRSAIASCLEAHDVAIEDLVESLERSDGSPRVDRILAAAGDAADCAVDPDVLAPLGDEVRQGLARVQVAKALGNHARALELADALAELAKREGSRRDALRIAFEIGDLRSLAGEHDIAQPLLAQAYFGAIAEGDDVLALDAAILSMRLVSMGKGDLEGAEWWRRAVLATLERTDPPRPLRARTLDALARLAQRHGDWAESRRITESLLADPEAATDSPTLQVRLGLLHAGILRHEGDGAGQLAALERVVDIAASHHVAGHPDIGLTNVAYGSALDDVGRADEAIAALQYGIAILERANMDDRIADPHYLLGRALMNAGRLDEAREHFEESREIYARVRGPEHPDELLPVIGLAEVAALKGDPQRARALYDEALVLGASRPGDRAHVVFAIGQLDLEAQHWDAALARYREARVVFADPQVWRVMLVETWVGEARALAGRGDVMEARAALAEARALAEPMPDLLVGIEDIAKTLP